MLVVVDRALRSPSLVLAELRTSLSFSPHFKAAAPCACLLHYYGDRVVAIFLANLPGKHRVYGRILTHIFSLSLPMPPRTGKWVEERKREVASL